MIFSLFRLVINFNFYIIRAYFKTKREFIMYVKPPRGDEAFYLKIVEKTADHVGWRKVSTLGRTVGRQVCWFVSSMFVPPEPREESKPYYMQTNSETLPFTPKENESQWINGNQKLLLGACALKGLSLLVFGPSAAAAATAGAVAEGVGAAAEEAAALMQNIEGMNVVQGGFTGQAVYGNVAWANHPVITSRQPRLRQRVGLELSEACHAWPAKFEQDLIDSDAEEDGELAFEQDLIEGAGEEGEKLAKVRKKIMEELIHAAKSRIANPEYALLATLDHLQDEIINTSPQKLLQTGEVIEDFLSVYQVAREKIAQKTFKNGHEEEQAWAQEMGKYWHKTFITHTANPLSKDKAIEAYIDEVVNRIKNLVFPDVSAFPLFQMVFLESYIQLKFGPKERAELKNAVVPFMDPSHYLGYLFEKTFKTFESLALWVESHLHLQILPEVKEDHVLIATEPEGVVRACSAKAKKWGIRPGMKVSDAMPILRSKLPPHLQSKIELKVPGLPGKNVVLVDTIGNREIVRAMSEDVAKKGVFVGMMASHAQLLMDKDSEGTDLVKLLRKGDKGAEHHFVGFMPLKDLFVAVMTALIDNGDGVGFHILNAEIRAFPWGGKFLSFLLSSSFLFSWPLRKVSTVSLRYLTGFSSTEKTAAEFFDKVLALVSSPAFKSLPLLWIDRLLALIEGAAPVEEIKGEAASLVSSAPSLAAAPKTIIKEKAVPIGTYTRDAVFGNGILSIFNTLVADLNPIKVPKSKIIRGGISLLFWTGRQVVTISFKLLDTRLTHSILDRGVKPVVLVAMKWRKNRNRADGSAPTEIDPQQRDQVEIAFDLSKKGIHVVAQGGDLLKTLHGLVSVVYAKAVELQWADPDDHRFAAANRNAGEFIHELILLASRSVIHFENHKKQNESHLIWKELSEFKTWAHAFAKMPQTASTKSNAREMSLRAQLKKKIEDEITIITKEHNALEIECGQMSKKLRSHGVSDLKTNFVQSKENSGIKWTPILSLLNEDLEDLKAEIKSERENQGIVVPHKYDKFVFLGNLCRQIEELTEKFENNEKCAELQDFLLSTALRWIEGRAWILDAKIGPIKGKMEELTSKKEILESARSDTASSSSTVDWKKIEVTVMDRMQERLHKANGKQFASVRQKEIEEIEKELQLARKDYQKFVEEESPRWHIELLSDHTLMEEFYKKGNHIKNPITPQSVLKSLVDNVFHWETKMREHYCKDERTQEKLLEELRAYKPALFKTMDKKQVLLKHRMETWEEKLYDAKKIPLDLIDPKRSDGNCCYTDPIWLLERSGADLIDPLKRLAFKMAQSDEIVDNSQFDPRKKIEDIREQDNKSG